MGEQRIWAALHVGLEWAYIVAEVSKPQGKKRETVKLNNAAAGGKNISSVCWWLASPSLAPRFLGLFDLEMEARLDSKYSDKDSDGQRSHSRCLPVPTPFWPHQCWQLIEDQGYKLGTQRLISHGHSSAVDSLKIKECNQNTAKCNANVCNVSMDMAQCCSACVDSHQHPKVLGQIKLGLKD